MKNKKNILAIAAIISLLIFTLIGCTDMNKTTEEVSVHLAPLRIKVNRDSDFKSDLVNQINISKNTIIEDTDFDLNYETILSNIAEFYRFEIYGYEIYQVSISENSLDFNLASIELLNTECDDTVDLDNIRISTIRPENWGPGTESAEEIFNSWAEQAKIQEWGYLTDDNMIYSSDFNEVSTPIGSTILTVRVPDHLNDYDYLRDLAQQVIASAELVNVDTELELLRQTEN